MEVEPAEQAPVLAEGGYLVHVPERRGHALLVALRRPDPDDRLVLIGQYYNSSGKVTGGLDELLLAGGDLSPGGGRPGCRRCRRTPRPCRRTPSWPAP